MERRRFEPKLNYKLRSAPHITTIKTTECLSVFVGGARQSIGSEGNETLSCKHSGLVPQRFSFLSFWFQVDTCQPNDMLEYVFTLRFSSGSWAKKSATTLPQTSDAFVFIGKCINILTTDVKVGKNGIGCSMKWAWLLSRTDCEAAYVSSMCLSVFRCISLSFKNVLYCIQNLQAVLEHILLCFRVHLDKGLWCHTERASLMWVNQPQPRTTTHTHTQRLEAVHHFLSSTQTSSDPEDRCRHLILSRWLEQRSPAADGLLSRPGWDMTRPQPFRGATDVPDGAHMNSKD